jgi:hypothetical protein
MPATILKPPPVQHLRTEPLAAKLMVLDYSEEASK